MPTSSNTDAENGPCRVCGATPSICEGLGVVRFNVAVDDPRFGKLFRCPNNPAEQDSDRQERLRLLSNLGVYNDKQFDNFYIEPDMLTPEQFASLQHALRASQNYARDPHGWLLLEGSYGTGKTHLAAAVGNYRLRQGDMVLFITVPDLLDHLRSTYGPSSEVGYDDLFERVRNTPILILDDLGAENASGWAQEKLFQLLNHRHGHHLPTVITTNLSVDRLDPRVGSRLHDEQMVRYVRIVAPDYRIGLPGRQQDQLSNLYLYRDMTFESFEVRTRIDPDERANLETAYNKARKFADDPEGRWLVLTGPYSSGKTHLAAAIANYHQAQGHTVMFVTVPDLLDYLRVTFNPDTPVTFDQRFQMVRNVPLLVLDDLGTENASSWAREKLFQIIDHRYVARLPTVITTAKLIEELDTRIVTRLADVRRCTIFVLTVTSYSERLKRHRGRPDSHSL
ncbi:MAG: ATP-binding protein [Anaerolineae bacterium]|nr:ATP-binding protein [Anaerolineae bacterium]